MNDDFAAQLSDHIKQAGLPVRRVADQAGLPHQTLYNWLRGTRPRWHPALPEDLRRLGGAGVAVGLQPRNVLLCHSTHHHHRLYPA